VIGIDPARSTDEGADVTGIIAAGIGADGEAYALIDLSGRHTPTEWARKAIACYHSLKADKIVVEKNFGGDMVWSTLESVDATVPVKEITSSRGKVLRAEPIASLFEQNRAHIVGSLPELEDQMAAFSSAWDRSRDGSPDRVDALVFAMTELMLGLPLGGLFRERALLNNDGESADMPTTARGGVCAVITAPGADSASIVYFAIKFGNRLSIIDWDVVSLDGAIDRRLFLSAATRSAQASRDLLSALPPVRPLPATSLTPLAWTG
jgi:hypothetical protein